ncbi:hypothetical protein ANCCAN_14081 [Ancylostoma caninum]|uniref:39S ribosomal protein L52, mitochondrial n=1 Tax=Ancylostoma caninum TaxID=29170 RepID=A0A368G6C0_ANCCA|nr:hypothetical protein ANCCAN_14081 [Ancylostoma caninum]
MTAISSRSVHRQVSKFRVVNGIAGSVPSLPPKNFVAQVRYDKEGRRITESVKSEPRALLQLKREELREREKQLMEKLEKLKRLRDAVRKTVNAGKKEDCFEMDASVPEN